MYKIDPKISKDFLEMIESAVNETARDPYVIEQVEEALQTYAQNLATEEIWEKGASKIELLEAVGEIIGFNCYNNDPCLGLAHTLADAVIEEISKRPASKKSKEVKKEVHSAPSLMDNDMDYGAYQNEPYPAQGFGGYSPVTRNPDLDDPRLKRVLRKK